MKTKSARLLKLFVQTLALNLFLIFCSRIFAGTAFVDIEPFAFNPSDVTINVGDSVVWTWVSDNHNTQSSSGLWDSGIQNTGFVFTNTFPNPGSFPYFCIVHGFTGNINVQTPVGPAIAITSPTNGASFAAPAIVSIVAAVTDTNGTVTNVSFFDGGTFLGATNNS